MVTVTLYQFTVSSINSIDVAAIYRQFLVFRLGVIRGR